MEAKDWVDDRLDEWAPFVRGGFHGVEGSSTGQFRERLDQAHESSFMPASVEITEGAVAKLRAVRRDRMVRPNAKSDLFRVLLLYYVARHSDTEIASRWGRTVGFVRSLRGQARGIVGDFILEAENQLRNQSRAIH